MSVKMWPFDGHVLFQGIDPPELASMVTLLLAGLTGLRLRRAAGPGRAAGGRRNQGRNGAGQDLARPLGVVAGTTGLLMLLVSHPLTQALPLPPALVLSLCGCLGTWLLRLGASSSMNDVHISMGQAEILHRLAVLARPADGRANGARRDGDRLVHQLALLAGLQPAEAAELQQAATFRHLGRIAIPDVLLHKVPLDDAERRLLRRAPAIGARLLGGGQSALFERAAEMALGHQERWDGTGYPRGLAGVQIPLAARIAALADWAAALLPSGRTTEPHLLDAALRRLEAEAGRCLDPVLTRLFLDTLRPAPLSPDAKRPDDGGQEVGGIATARPTHACDPAALLPAVSCGPDP